MDLTWLGVTGLTWGLVLRLVADLCGLFVVVVVTSIDRANVDEEGMSGLRYQDKAIYTPSSIPCRHVNSVWYDSSDKRASENSCGDSGVRRWKGLVPQLHGVKTCVDRVEARMERLIPSNTHQSRQLLRGWGLAR